MFEIIAGLIVAFVFVTCAWRWLFLDETPVFHSILAFVCLLVMVFISEGGVADALRLFGFFVGTVILGLVITAAMNKGID